MNYFDFSTVYTAFWTSNLLLMLIAVMICNKKVMINAGYKLITIFLVLTAIRFMLPFEVPFATSIPLPQGISRISVFLFTPLFAIRDMDVTPMNMILLIWLLGVIVQGYRCYRSNYGMYMYIFTHGKNVTKDPHYGELMKEICGKQASSFSIFEVENLETPFIFGLFRPFILVPAGYESSDRELRYILMHEVSHFRRRDLLTKFLVQLLSIIYWWNPFGYMLRDQTDLVLEMRIDDVVAGLNKEEMTEYLDYLLNLAEYQDELFDLFPMGNIIAMSKGHKKVLTKRFQMLTQGKRKKKNWVLNLLLICLVGSIYILSYLFALEAYNSISDVDKEAIRINQLSSFLIDNGDGTYDLYFSNYKLETINSLEHYSEDIPIFTREEFEHAQQKTAD